jgi:hypothetical protein
MRVWSVRILITINELGFKMQLVVTLIKIMYLVKVSNHEQFCDVQMCFVFLPIMWIGTGFVKVQYCGCTVE